MSRFQLLISALLLGVIILLGWWINCRHIPAFSHTDTTSVTPGNLGEKNIGPVPIDETFSIPEPHLSHPSGEVTSQDFQPASKHSTTFSKLSARSVQSLADLRTRAGFFENKGQWSAHIQYRLQRPGIQVALQTDGITYTVPDGDAKNSTALRNVKVHFTGANPPAQIIATGTSKDTHNYITAAATVAGVHHYQQIIYKNIYPQIDVVFYPSTTSTQAGGFKYNFIVHPGGNPQDIQLRYTGVDNLSLKPLIQSTETKSGFTQNKLLHLSVGEIVLGEQITESYLLDTAGRTPADVSYTLAAPNTVKMQVAAYDTTKTLVIDPELIEVNLRLATYYGSDATDRIVGVVIENDGSVYVAGSSTQSGLATTGSHQDTLRKNNDMLIAKFSPDLKTLLVATYYGGEKNDEAQSITLDAENNVYVGGYTESDSLPMLGDSIYKTKGKNDIVVARFSNDLSTLQWSVGVGGSESEKANKIVSLGDNVAVVGTAESAGLQMSGEAHHGEKDAFVMALDRSSGTRQWFNYFGGARVDEGKSVAINDGMLYVTGDHKPDLYKQNVFLAVYNASGTLVNQKNYGDLGFVAYDIAIDQEEEFLTIVGEVGETHSELPGTSVNQKKYGGDDFDGFLFKINTPDLSVDWATFYGGDKTDRLLAVEIDCQHHITVAGHSQSENIGELIAKDGYRNKYQGGGGDDETFTGDVILVKFDQYGQRLWGSYFGGGGEEKGTDLTLDPNGNVVLCGTSTSDKGIATKGTYDSMKTGDGFTGFISSFCDVLVTELPEGVTKTPGDDANFTVQVAYCDDDIKYEWRKDGVLLTNGGAISGADTATLSITGLTFDHAGEYCVTIYTSCDTLDSLLCAELKIVELQGNDVCLDTATVSGIPSANQELITLTFEDFKDNPHITNVQYSWFVTAEAGNVAGANTAVAGSAGSFPLTLPTGPQPDLDTISIQPTAPGRYRYKLVFTYDDDRQSAPVTDSTYKTINVYASPTLSSVTMSAICDGVAPPSVSFASDEPIGYVIYERVDALTDLLGNPKGEARPSEGVEDAVDLELEPFNNITNLPLTAVYKIIPFSPDSCQGKTQWLNITVNPKPQLTVQVEADTLCNESSVNIQVQAATSPYNFELNGGTVFTYERLDNPAITPAPLPQPTALNNVTIDETLTNTGSTPQTVTYQFKATYNTCDTIFTQSITLLPSVIVTLNEPEDQAGCSGTEFNMSLTAPSTDITTTLEVTFNTNTNLSGQRDTTLQLEAGESTDLLWTFINLTNAEQTITATVKPLWQDQDGSRCEGTVQTKTFTVSPPPGFTNDAVEVCAGSPLDIDLISLGNGSTNFSWTVSNPDGFVTGQTAASGNRIDQVLSLTTGNNTGTVIYHVTPEVGGCPGAPGTVTVTVLAAPTIDFSLSPYADICSANATPVTITADVTGANSSTVESYQWFAEGDTIPGETSTILTIDTTGTYRLDIVSAGRCAVSKSIFVPERERTEIAISLPTVSTTCAATPIVLATEVTGGPIDSFQWLLDNTPLAGASDASIRADQPGSYQVIVNPGTACADTSNTVPINFFPDPKAFFTLADADTALCPFETITLNGTNQNAAATVDKVAWQILEPGANAAMTTPDQLTTALSVGENKTASQRYTIQLTLETTQGCRDSIQDTLIAHRRPDVKYTFPGESCSGTVSLATQETEGATAYAWDVLTAFGGIMIDDATQRDPVFQVNNNSADTLVHQIRLIATDNFQCTDSLTNTLNVFPGPTMMMNPADTTVCADALFNLTSTDSHPGEGLSFTDYAWRVNGVLQTTAESYAFTAINDTTIDSVYTIELSGTNNIGCQGESSGTIIVKPGARAEIKGDQTSACVPFTIDQNTLSVHHFAEANTTAYQWTVDSAGVTLKTATGELPPTYTLTEAGAQIAYILTAFSPHGCAADYDTVPFISFPAAQALANPEQDTACAGQLINFLNNSINADSYEWQFGDGDKSEAEEPPHAYANTNPTLDTTYTVVLLARSPDNCVDTDTTNVTIHPLPVIDFIFDNACAGQTVTVLNKTTGKGALTYTWTSDDPTLVQFDDPAAREPKLIISGSLTGDRSVDITLQVHSEDQCTQTHTQKLQIFALPQAAMAVDTSQCVQVPVIFENLSANPSLALADSIFIFSYGDGQADTLRTKTPAQHTYTTAGTYTVNLTAINTGGCQHTDSRQIVVNNIPQAVITSSLNPLSGCAPVIATFQSDNSILYGGETYHWAFGNGQTETIPNPAPVTYAQNNQTDTTYTAYLTLANACGSHTDSTDILVKPKPVAQFQPALEYACDDISTKLINGSQGLPDLYIWNYGDGSPADSTVNGDPVNHVFQNNGDTDVVYTVILTAVNDCGMDADTATVTVVPFDANGEIALSEEDSHFCVGDSITAVAAGIGGTAGREITWTLDGVTTFHNLAEITFPIYDPGVHLLTLDVYVAACDGNVQGKQTLIVEAGPDISFNTDSIGCINTGVRVQNTSPLPAATTQWDMGDGKQYPGVTPPTHYYDTAGYYTITMALTGANECKTEKTRQVLVKNAPIAEFQPVDRLCKNQQITFENLSVDAQSYAWHIPAWADSSYTKDLVRTFDTVGSYIIALTAYTELAQQGCQHTTQQRIRIDETPDAKMDISVDKICENESFTLTSNSQGAVQYLWLLRDQDTAVTTDTLQITTSQAPFQTSIDQANDYMVVLQAFSVTGCAGEDEAPLRVVAVPIIAVDTIPQAVCGDMLYEFKNDTDRRQDSNWVFQWFLNDTLITEQYQPTPFKFPRPIGYNTSGEVHLEVTHDICYAEKFWNLTIPGMFGCSFQAPNAFSPNHDGENDQFKVVFHPNDLDNIKEVSFRVFNTTEHLLYEVEMSRPADGEPMECHTGCDTFNALQWENSVQWDGTIRGVEADRGTYFYTLSVRCCNKEPKPAAAYFQLLK